MKNTLTHLITLLGAILLILAGFIVDMSFPYFMAAVLLSLVLGALLSYFLVPGKFPVGLSRPRIRPIRLVTDFLYMIFLLLLLGGIGMGFKYMDGMLPRMDHYAWMKEGPGTYLLGILVVWFFRAGVGEVLIRGYIMNHFYALFSNSRPGKAWAWFFAVLLSTGVSVLVHYHEGPGGMILAGIFGAIMAGIYLISDRDLWNVIIVHGLYDTVQFTLYYLGFQL